MNWSTQVNTVIDNLATKLGPVVAAGAKDGFALLMRQVMVWGVERAALAVLWLAVMYAIYKAIMWLYPMWKTEYDACPDDSAFALLFLWALPAAAASAVAVTGFVTSTQLAINYLLNPAYYALTLAAHLVK